MKPPKVMLHPQRATTLRTAILSIDGNVAGYISWSRLIDAMRVANEFNDGERIEAFVIENDGITFYMKNRPKPEPTPAPRWKVGDFAMHRGTLVRLDQESSPGRFTVAFVSNYEHGAGICCGGYASSYAGHELSPVVEVENIILATAYAAMKRIEAAKSEIVAQEAVFAANKAALDAFRMAREVAK